MGLITAVLSYVIKIHKLVIGLRQKDTEPSYDADLDSNEAIRDAVDNVYGTVNNNNALIQEARSDNNSWARHRLWELAVSVNSPKMHQQA